MAKTKPYPKAPKKTASLKTWENYREKIKEIDRFNAQLKTNKAKKESLIKAVVSMKSKRK